MNAPSSAVVSQVASIDIGLDAFLAWAEERGTPLDPRAAHAVLTLLALRGAKRRRGFPEPTAELAIEILHHDLPLFVAASEEELPGYPAVLVALADRTHEVRLLNAKARARIASDAEASVREFTRRMTDPTRLTWYRLYAGLLREDGARLDDPDAVKGWLHRFADRPAAERRSAVSRVADPAVRAEAGSEVKTEAGDEAGAQAGAQAGGQAEDLTGTQSGSAVNAGADDLPDETGVVERQRRMLLASATENAVLHLQRLVLESLASDLRMHFAARRDGTTPLIDLTQDDESPIDLADALALDLLDHWSAAGLPAALKKEFRHLAPLTDDLPAYPLMQDLTHWCREMLGEGPGHLPPPVREIARPDRLAELLRAAPLPSALARLAGWVAERGGVSCSPAQGERRGDAEVPSALPGQADLSALGELIGLTDPLAVQEVWILARTSGFLRLTRSATGAVTAVPGDAYELWDQAGPAEAAHIAADLLGAILPCLGLLADRAAATGAEGAYETVIGSAEDLLHTLWRLYEEQEPESLIRMAAVRDMWALPAGTDDEAPVLPPGFATESPHYPPLAEILRAPVAPDDAVRAALLPGEDEVARLLGLDDLSDEERSELADLAYWEGLVLDRLHALGVLCRSGDVVAMTSLGKALLRDLLRLGGILAPTMAEVADRPVDALLSAIRWPPSLATPAVMTWVERRGGSVDAWREFLGAIADVQGTDQAVGARLLFGMFGVVRGAGGDSLYGAGTGHRFPAPLPHGESALRTALAEAVADPAIGAYAAAALALRTTAEAGPKPPVRGDAPEDSTPAGAGEEATGAGEEATGAAASGSPMEPPIQARAVMLADELLWLVYEEVRKRNSPTSEEPLPADGTALCKAFDEAAADWPGAAEQLISALARTDSVVARPVLESLAENHAQRSVAALAAVEVRKLEASSARSASKPGSDGRRSGGRSKRKRGKAR